MLHYIVIKQVNTPVHNSDIGVPLLYKALCFRPIPQQFPNVRSGDASLTERRRPRDYHVILCLTFEFFSSFKLGFSSNFLFEF
jgi:hypothetical protein